MNKGTPCESDAEADNRGIQRGVFTARLVGSLVSSRQDRVYHATHGMDGFDRTPDACFYNSRFISSAMRHDGSMHRFTVLGHIYVAVLPRRAFPVGKLPRRVASRLEGFKVVVMPYRNMAVRSNNDLEVRSSEYRRRCFPLSHTGCLSVHR